MIMNMNDPVIRKAAITVSGYYALCGELKGVKSRGPSVLKRMQQEDMGFTSKRKGPMVCEIYTWLASINQAPYLKCLHCGGINHSTERGDDNEQA